MRLPVCTTALTICSCQGFKDEPSGLTEVQDVEVPTSVSAGGGVLRVTFAHGSIDEEENRAQLEKFFSGVFSPSRLLTRGGLEHDESGGVIPLSWNTDAASIAAMVGGSTPDQARALLIYQILNDSGLKFSKSDAIDQCDNYMLAYFLSPDMNRYLYTTLTTEEILLGTLWPGGVCGDDLDCNTTTESTWTLSLEGESEDTYSIRLQTSGVDANGRESVGFSGHFTTGFLIDDQPLGEEVWGGRDYPTYIAIDAMTIDVAHGAQQVGETEGGTIWYLLGQGDKSLPEISVVTTPITNCRDYFDEFFEGDYNVPYGCDNMLDLPVTIDTNSVYGYDMWDVVFQKGTEPTISSHELLSELSEVLEYQMSAALACLREEALDNDAGLYDADVMTIEFCDGPELTNCTAL